VICFDIFRRSVYALYKSPILFLLPSIGSAISIIVEVLFITGLYNNNTDNYFPFSNTLALALFFIAFVITYLQLTIASNVVLKKASASGSKNHYYGERIVDVFIIYSIYALALVHIGDYENDIRKSFSAKSDRFSLYTFKLKSHNDIISIIPFGILLTLLSVIFSFIFNMWLVQYYSVFVENHHLRHRYYLYESLKNMVSITISKDRTSKIVPLVLVTVVISILGFILTNIAIISVAESLNMYIFQFTISSIIGTIYSPFYLICLFLILLPRS
jgi:hypothetical protein